MRAGCLLSAIDRLSGSVQNLMRLVRQHGDDQLSGGRGTNSGFCSIHRRILPAGV
jgi:hypothetical protein